MLLYIHAVGADRTEWPLTVDRPVALGSAGSQIDHGGLGMELVAQIGKNVDRAIQPQGLPTLMIDPSAGDHRQPGAIFHGQVGLQCAQRDLTLVFRVLGGGIGGHGERALLAVGSDVARIDHHQLVGIVLVARAEGHCEAPVLFAAVRPGQDNHDQAEADHR